jgi:DNA polymerase
VNDRGVPVDTALVTAAQGIVDEGIRHANRELAELTNGDVPKVTGHARLKKWLVENGVTEVDAAGDVVPLTSTDKPHVTALLDKDDLTPHVRKALLIRESAGLSSLAKLKTMLLCACSDMRARGLLLYHGAVPTGRWAGRLIQPQNFPRGTVDDVEQYLEYIRAGAYDTIALFEQPLKVISSALRSMLRASPGNDLIAADYSAIEAKVLNWLAGEQGPLNAWRAGKDVYKVNAARLYNVLYEVVTKLQRQTGKFQELGCGFGMGAKKAVAAGTKTYGLTLSDDEAKAIVDNYRMTHPKVVEFWYETERACIEAINTPGLTVPFGDKGRLKVKVAGAYMYIRLPSGRKMAYPAPRVVEAETPWGEMKPTVEVHGVDSKTNEWCRQRLYGGLIVENIVQAVARDIMAEGMLRVEDHGFQVVLSVHDEVVAEVPKDFQTVRFFEDLLSTPPAWAADCPISAEGWRGERYKK